MAGKNATRRFILFCVVINFISSKDSHLFIEEKYNTASVKDLLLAFKRNKVPTLVNYVDLTLLQKHFFASDSFIKSFPSLLIHTYTQMKKYKQKQSWEKERKQQNNAGKVILPGEELGKRSFATEL